MRVAGIYLAAGHGRRAGVPKASPKLPPELTPESVVVSELERCTLDPLVVVVRADDNLVWLPPAAEQSSRRTETCLTAHLGLSFSLRCGLNAILPLQPDAVVVALAGQTSVTASLVNRLKDMYMRNPELDYVAGTHEGLPLPPALFSREMFSVLQGLEGGEGTAGLFRSSEYKGAVLQTDSAGSFSDADPRFGVYDAHKAWSIRGES
ncbi:MULTISPECIES: NTP transferase domain-containing protein [unclassified Paenibacillus]|uniref:NTP transferase domain-containing protein n=1 Tax=unclassified Paenibacillus TaxID=185978 RepID=UPI0024075443|nr:MULTISPECIES: NTP transferase domain-containing protein [unclassified Paenibacillus]MDF9843516.1 molybdenum cofactor cytidylyltransferase [Paenibacillus sp. PastF-2]MDF9850104.1 molybdenum cofactor cytidylyltransferase [Paenibacillus sp. PastM-2]MDF9857154.1 molybdenum cofactor cytidylyltransferase [Paenibacillus sp. PastF-1]MDH6482424.1 molybdenum cofactor cytidylyltransferase [Paenibacillus sp. PastH-2]MDH6509238.1 molybdenum cofactor cytidylyltransferase [Paenibacillus sp. PastM-3]